MKQLALSGLLFFLIAPALSQSGTIAGLDSFFSKLQQTDRVMGSIAICRSGKMLYTRSIGFSSYSGNQTISADNRTKYRIGSISKTFTAAIVLQLIEEGRLSLDTPLSVFFPDYPQAARITIGHLLNHRSGIRNYTKIKSMQRPRSKEEMLNMFAKSTLQFSPGTNTLYSNANYVILGYVIEKILKKTFAEVLQERIASPTALANTYFGHRPDTNSHESFSYQFRDGWVQDQQTDLSIPGASGGIQSTPADLAFYIEALFSKKIIKQESLDKMKTIINDYGMGMTEFEFHAKKAYGQVGAIDNFESVVAYFPADSLAISFCANGRVDHIKNIIITALNIFFGYTHDNSDHKTVIAKPKGLLRYAGIFSSKQLPVKIILTTDKEGLVAQPEGYPSYILKPEGVNTFRCDSANVVLRFNSGKTKFTMQQADNAYTFVRE